MWTAFAEKRVKFIIAFLLIAALYAVYGISCQLGLNRLQQEARRSLEQVASALFVPVDKYSYLPEVIASQPVIAAALLDSDSLASIGRSNAYLENIHLMTEVEAIYLLDRDGLTVASSNGNTASSFVGHNYSFRPYFQDAIKGGQGRLYAQGTTSKTPGYYLSYPVRAEGKVIGVVAIKIDLSNFDHEWHAHSAYEVTVTDEHGVNFLSSVPDWKYRPMQELEPAVLEHLRQTRQYDASLKSPLPITGRKSRGGGAEHLTISLPDATRQRTVEKSYVMETGELSWSAWKVNIFMPADRVEDEAIKHTLIAAALMLIILLMALYWNEARRRTAEGDKARRAIETAHAELEEKHQNLAALSRELERLAYVDDLTGSYNRRFFYEIAAKMLSAGIRHKLPLSIIVIDVDFFKRINDEHGHHVGDMILKDVSRICTTGLREGDVFARLGGEEFVMALMPTSENDALEVAERLRRNVMDYFFTESGRPIKITISCGVAQFRPSDTAIESTVQRADRALYHAKQAGRNRIAVSKAAE